MSRKYTTKLHNKRVLVIGGTSGIGFAVAEASVEYGAIVVVASSMQEKIQRAVEKIQKANPDTVDRIRGHRLDLASDDVEAQLKTLLDFATDNGQNKLDHIVETAGDTLNPTPLQDSTAQLFGQLGRVRIIGPILVAKLAKQYMNDSSSSSFTLTGGASSIKPPDNRAALAGVACAKEGLTRGLAKDLRPIRVNIIVPGVIHTELFEGLVNRIGLPMEEVLASYKKNTLTNTVGKPEDLAESYLALMKNKFATGSINYVEGGYLLI